ncbi:hypothetical protein CYLTODRAFT_317327, partial [Cylindrobasidium torrendii FP15055 ss-10]
MEALQDGLNDMLAKRDDLDAAIHSRRAVLAPIRVLPDDILGSIFMWCTPTIGAPDWDETPDSLDVFSWPPWVISHVCRRWRNVALAQKSLWATLALYRTP